MPASDRSSSINSRTSGTAPVGSYSSSTGTNRSCTGPFLVPQRYVLCIMATLALCLAHAMRTSVMIMGMPILILTNETTHSKYACKVPLESLPLLRFTNFSRDAFHSWNVMTKGLFTSSFYWGYLASHVPSGYLADQFGGKHVLTTGLMGFSICGLLTPWILEESTGSYTGIFTLRFLDGIFQGTTYPSLSALFAYWTIEREKSAVIYSVYATAFFGFMTSTTLKTVFTRYSQTWSVPFYLFGSLGLVWCVVWHTVGYSRPYHHPFINNREKVLILDELEGHVVFVKKKVPWRFIVSSLPVWALVVGQIGHVWCWFGLLEHLALYVETALKISFELQAVWLVLPTFPICILGVTFGCVSDWLVYDKRFNKSKVRKTFVAISMVGVVIFLLLGSLARCDRVVALFCFTMAMCCMGVFFCNMKVISLDLAPNFAGLVMALTNTLALLIGVAGPWINEGLKSDNPFSAWSQVVWLNLIIVTTSGAVFIVFGSADEQYWNQIKPEEDL